MKGLLRQECRSYVNNLIIVATTFLWWLLLKAMR